MKRTAIKILCLFLILSAFPLFSQNADIFGRVDGAFKPSVEQFPNGYIDWGNGYYYTVSKGYPPEEGKRVRRKLSDAMKRKRARDAAVRGAMSQILQMAKNIRVDAEATVGDLEVAGFKVKISGDIKDYEIVKEGWAPDVPKPYYEVVMKAPISGVSGQLIESQITKMKTGKRGPVVPPAPEPEPEPEIKEPVPEPEPQPEPMNEKEKKIEDIKKKAADAEAEMLLIIDARGTGANQAVFPEVKSTDGAEIFNITLPSNLKAKRKPMVKYIEHENQGKAKGHDKDKAQGKAKGHENDLINELKTNKRILYVQAIMPVDILVEEDCRSVVYAADEEKAEPKKKRRRFSARASKSAGKLKANIIISKDDAEKIIAANKKEKFFENANVYVIMDSSIGGTEGCIRVPAETILSQL